MLGAWRARVLPTRVAREEKEDEKLGIDDNHIDWAGV
jgi:hypothetical protein